MSLADLTIGRSIAVPAYPGSLALSPNGRYLVIGHYASSQGSTLLQPGRDALTVIDLTNDQKRSYGLANGPVGVAIGSDGLALVLTQSDFLLFDPASGVVTTLGSVDNVASQSLPVPSGTFPPQIIGGRPRLPPTAGTSSGIGGVLPDEGSGSKLMRFSYNVPQRAITAQLDFTAAPSLGPRVLSVSRDGSYYMTGWALFGCGFSFLRDCTAGGPLLAQLAERVGEPQRRLGRDPLVEIADLRRNDAAGRQDGELATQTVCLPNGTCVRSPLRAPLLRRDQCASAEPAGARRGQFTFATAFSSRRSGRTLGFQLRRARSSTRSPTVE